jgi:hypothetical protein
MKKSLKELSSLFEALVSDVDFQSKNLESEQARRAYIRAVFALVEGHNLWHEANCFGKETHALD